MLGEECEVDALTVPGGAQRIRAPGPHRAIDADHVSRKDASRDASANEAEQTANGNLDPGGTIVELVTQFIQSLLDLEQRDQTLRVLRSLGPGRRRADALAIARKESLAGGAAPSFQSRCESFARFGVHRERA